MKVKKQLLFFACFIFLGVSKICGQTIQVSGKVTDKISGKPLAGATISIKGSETATATDADGKFTITAPGKGSVLSITNVDMKTVEIKVSDNSPISVAMETAGNTLEEVVVNVGYGTQKKSVTTGAISSIRAKDLEKVPNGRVEQALQGRVAGVTIASNAGQPGAASTVRIRGISTFGDAGNDPLWVVDGIVVDNGAIGYLNQSDIESIEVLKDATSAAIYGTRGGKGVILITTKKGKAGKFSVSYNAFWGTSSASKRVDLLNATQYATLYNEKSVAGGGSIIYDNPSKYGKGTDWQKEIFNNAKRFSHELSMSGGNERSTYYVSFGWQDQQGIVLKDISSYTKKSLRINSTHKISKIFTIGQTLGYTHQRTVGIGNTNSEYGGALSSALNLDPITPVIITDTAISGANPYSSQPVIRDENGNPYAISTIVGQEMTNPKAYAQTRLGNFNWSDDIIANIFLEAAVTRKIKFRSSLGGKLAYWGGQGYTPVYYLSASNNTVKNNYSKNNNNTFNWNVENTVTYTDRIADHSFDILLGQGAYLENNGGGSSVTLFGLPITRYQDASFNFDIPESDRTSGSYDFVNHTISSLFARANYNYKERYLFTGIIRRDGSSKFGPNNKYASFPSFSLGWVINKENFWQSNKYINSLKLRAGYGKVGNDGIGDFGYLSRVQGYFGYTLGNSNEITTGYAPLTLANPDLKWEVITQSNVGIDAQLLRDFTLTLEMFNKKTSDILRPIKIPGYVGVTDKPFANIADMKNSGLEVELGYRKKFGQLNFSLNASLATLKNEVTYVNADTNFVEPAEGLNTVYQSMGSITRIQVGNSYNYFYGFKTAGIFQNEAEIQAYSNKDGGLIQPDARPGDFRWVDNNGDGKIDDKDKTNLGRSLPNLTFGITINLEYKGFDLMAFGQGAAGNKIFQGLHRLDIANANYSTKALSRWTGEGTSNDFPRLTSNDKNGNFTKMSDFYLEKGDYFRLKVLQLGYSYNNNFFRKIGLSRLRVYVTAENLFTITKYTGFDPEVGGSIFGVDRGFYPQARSFIGGVQVQF